MKRLAFIMMALLLALMPAAAQNYRDSRYYLCECIEGKDSWCEA